MNKLKLFNDEVIATSETSAIVKNNNKYRAYNKGTGIHGKEYDNYIKLNNKIYLMYCGAHLYSSTAHSLIINGEVVFECTISGRGSDKYDEIVRIIDNNMTLDDWMNQRTINKYNVALQSLRKGNFFITDVSGYWGNTRIFHIYNYKTHEELIKGYTIRSIIENTNDCISVQVEDENDHSKSKCLLINDKGEILVSSEDRIDLADKSNNVWMDSSGCKLYKIKNGAIERACKQTNDIGRNHYWYMSKYIGSKRCIYLEDAEALNGAINRAANGVYLGVTIKEFTNAIVKDMYGTEYGTMDKLQYIESADTVIMYSGDSVGLLNLEPLTFKELKNVKKIRLSCCKERGLAIIFNDDTYKFYFNGKFTDEAEGWLIKKRVDNKKISRTAYVCMDKKYNWYITDVNGEIIIDNKFETEEEAREEFLSYINALSIQDIVLNVVLYDKNR